jgi:deoxycytidine triphosphate deaminase
MLLSDEELVKLDPTIVIGLDRSGDLYSAKSRIQPASIDLTIGDILLPEINQDQEGSLQKPLKFHRLRSGHTAIVQTKEKLDLPSDLAAIGFPPSSVSSQGLLMTNPGHVDPGYKGRMKFTVINMGRESFLLKTGEIIVTLLFFRLTHSATKSYSERNPVITGDVTEQQLSTLAKDFLDFERRAEDVAKKTVQTERWWNVGVPVVGTLIGVAVVVIASYLSINSKLNEFEIKLTESKFALQKEILTLSNQIQQQRLEKRIEDLEKGREKQESKSR